MSSRPPRWAVDANVILRYLLRDDEELAGKAQAIWHAVEDGRLVAVCDPITLAEVVFVMSSVYRLPNAEISEALIALLHSDGLLMAAKQRYVHALRLFADTVKHFGDACARACALEECEGRRFSFDREPSSVCGVDRRETIANAGEPDAAPNPGGESRGDMPNP
jgi:predicted nucleic acid-binding protein